MEYAATSDRRKARSIGLLRAQTLFFSRDTSASKALPYVRKRNAAHTLRDESPYIVFNGQLDYNLKTWALPVFYSNRDHTAVLKCATRLYRRYVASTVDKGGSHILRQPCDRDWPFRTSAS